MRFAKTPRYLPLEITGVAPCFYQALQECLIGSLVGRVPFVHKLRLRERPVIPQNRELPRKVNTSGFAKRRI